jgi:hypothetical protein
MIELSQISISEAITWDFEFRYDIYRMPVLELEVLMLKYEVQLKRTDPGNKDQYFQITDILGKIYREIMKRRMRDYFENR